MSVSARLWIAKPAMHLVIIPDPPWPDPWLAAFVHRQDYLPCIGVTRSGRPCQRPVYRWHVGGHPTPFSAYCGLHTPKLPPDDGTTWQFQSTGGTVACPCGCGAEVSWAAAAVVPVSLPWNCLIAVALNQIGPDQWQDSSSVWRTTMSNAVPVTDWMRDNPGDPTGIAYRDWLFDGPLALWERDPEWFSPPDPPLE